MILTLRAVSLNDQPLTRPITARFDAAGGTVGRADHSTLALPDPERFISRKQAEIVFVNGGFLIRNVGAANPINLGSRALANGESTMLGDGDEVRIGGYLLRAEYGTAAPMPAPAAPPAVVQAPVPRTAPPVQRPSNNPFADLLGGGDDLLGMPAPAPSYGPSAASPAGAADPFADLLGSPASTHVPAAPVAARSGALDDFLPPAAGLTAQSAAVAPPPSAAPRLPDDFDPFGSPAAPALGQRAAAPLDPFADFAPVAPPVSIDQQFGLSAGAGAGGQASHDPLKDFEFGLGALGSAAPGASVPSTDPMAMFAPSAAKPGAGPAPLPMQDNLPGVNAAFEPPRLAPLGRPAPPAPASRSLPPDVPAGPMDATLWQAFCDGAGVQIPMPADPALAAARLRQVGLVMRAAVEGTRELMAVRASTKYELRASVTQIQARSNNPLKFAPDTRTGMEQLVQPAVRGFLEGPAAMEDAMRDLVGHSIGSVAGMRAALEGLLDRFDPATLEKILGSGSVLDNLVPLNRKARLWELYLQRFRALREEAQEDFHALFGKAFVAAYEQQVARLKQGSGGGRGKDS